MIIIIITINKTEITVQLDQSLNTNVSHTELWENSEILEFFLSHD